MPAQMYLRMQNGVRLDLLNGINTMWPTDLIQATMGFPYLQNVRRNLSGRAVSRPALSPSILGGATSGLPITSVNVMFDPYMVAPPDTALSDNYVLLFADTLGTLYLASSIGGLFPSPVVTRLSALPKSFVNFRPNASPQPWCYIADGTLGPILIPNSLANSVPTLLPQAYPEYIYENPVAGMIKVRANNANLNASYNIISPLVYKIGIAEPQIPPLLVFGNPATDYESTQEWVIYRYVYRSSATGALSNPSPESYGNWIYVTPWPTNSETLETGPTGPYTITNSALQWGFQLIYNAAQWVVDDGNFYIRTSGSVNPGTLTAYFTALNWQENNQAARPPGAQNSPVGNIELTQIPSNDQIAGIEVTLNWYGQDQSYLGGTGVLFAVSLFYQNEIIGVTKSPGVSNLGPPIGSGNGTTPLANLTTTVGGPSDTWGANLSAAIVNDPSFGVGFQIESIESPAGTDRSFINWVTLTVYTTAMNIAVTAVQSPDPQVDKIDIYRQTNSLDNFTYTGTIDNPPNAVSAGFTDTQNDIALSTNPILVYDNYEPFPSIDLPRNGTVNIIPIAQGSSVWDLYHLAPPDPNPNIIPTPAPNPNTNLNPAMLQWASGDPFNVRWLPGNLVLLPQPGTNDQTAWTMYTRPFQDPDNPALMDMLVNTSQIDPITGLPEFVWPQVGANDTPLLNQSYQIVTPTLAAQPSPVIWGPTPESGASQAAFYFGIDPLNPGDLVWSNGNNFDSASDANRVTVTSPSEILMNGVVTSELNAVFSTERFWLIYPNFADVVLTVTGDIAGQQWTLIQAQATRGLYCRYAIAAIGAMIVWRARDCVCVSTGGGPEQSITDSIYNLFPHGGQLGGIVTIAGMGIYPPDDTRPDAQTITATPNYIYYNYQDINGTQRTLVFDVEAKGWSVDVYNPTAVCHGFTEANPQSLLMHLQVGCSDGTVRWLGSGGVGGEQGTSIVVTRSENGGDARAPKRLGDIFFKAEIEANFPVGVEAWKTLFTNQLTGYGPTSLTGTSGVEYFIVDFTSGLGQSVDDVGVVLSWGLGSTNVFDLWQPNWIPLPEIVQDRPSDWDDGGTAQNKFVQGLLLECNTFGQAKIFSVESDNDRSFHTPVECPFTQDGQAIRSFTFSPPFTAHMIRIVSTDGVKWQFGTSAGGNWDTSWVDTPYPEASTVWTTQYTSLGLLGWCFIYQVNLAYASATPVTLTVNTDQGSFTLTFPPSEGGGTLPSKILRKCPRNKWKIINFTATSTAAFSLFQDWTEVWIRSWGESSEFHKINPFGGQASPAATI